MPKELNINIMNVTEITSELKKIELLKDLVLHEPSDIDSQRSWGDKKDLDKYL